MKPLLGGWVEGFTKFGQHYRCLVKLDVPASCYEPGWYQHVGGNTDRELLLLFVANDPHRFQHRVAKGFEKLMKGNLSYTLWKLEQDFFNLQIGVDMISGVQKSHATALMS